MKTLPSRLAGLTRSLSKECLLDHQEEAIHGQVEAHLL
jgi:hypothetical protein